MIQQFSYREMKGCDILYSFDTHFNINTTSMESCDMIGNIAVSPHCKENNHITKDGYLRPTVKAGGIHKEMWLRTVRLHGSSPSFSE